MKVDFHILEIYKIVLVYRKSVDIMLRETTKHSFLPYFYVYGYAYNC